MRERPFHEGEREAQRRAGLDVLPGGAGIRDFMPDQHRAFFPLLPFLAAATLDERGAPTATLITGEPGFVQSPDPYTLTLAADPRDPAGARLAAGAPAGFLGVQFETRRRNRANGRIRARGTGGLSAEVLQSFGNCPQYIQLREMRLEPAAPGGVQTFDGLDAQARQTLAVADTLFVATASGAGVENGGLDISHRGGLPGFARIEGEALTIPDFRGNRFFNTLGNLLLEPRAALLVLDFDTGVLTQLQGRAEVLWDLDEDHGGAMGAQRSWRFTVERGWRRPTELRGRFLEFSETTLRTGT